MRAGPKLLTLNLALSAAALAGRDDANHAMQEMVRGIQLYQKSAIQPYMPKREKIWSAGQVKLFRITGDSAVPNPEAPVCLLVPSLINGSGILDLCEDRSFALWMKEQGLDVYLIDWGDLLQDNAQMSLDNLLLERLLPAVNFLKHAFPDKSETRVHTIGYCMGGSLCAGLESHVPGLFGSLTLLASPWNFFTGEQKLLQHVRFWSPSAMSILASKNYLCAESLHSLFAGLDPLSAQKKFAKFAKMDTETAEAKLFIAVEDWLNEGRDLPYKIAYSFIVDWFLNNAPNSGAWNVAGKPVDLSFVKAPLHIVASRNDKLVEYAVATSILEHLPDSKLTTPSCGHIGMIAGKDCIETVWMPMASWIKKQSQ